MTFTEIYDSEAIKGNKFIMEIYKKSFVMNLEELITELELVTIMLKIKYQHEVKQKALNNAFCLEKELNVLFNKLNNNKEELRNG